MAGENHTSADSLNNNNLSIDSYTLETQYDLYCTIHHIGALSGGHYVTAVKHSNSTTNNMTNSSSHSNINNSNNNNNNENKETNTTNEKWWLYNDEVTSEIKDTSEICSPSAYLLFYIRKDIQSCNNINDLFDPLRAKTTRKATNSPNTSSNGLDGSLNGNVNSNGNLNGNSNGIKVNKMRIPVIRNSSSNNNNGNKTHLLDRNVISKFIPRISPMSSSNDSSNNNNNRRNNNNRSGTDSENSIASNLNNNNNQTNSNNHNNNGNSNCFQS